MSTAPTSGISVGLLLTSVLAILTSADRLVVASAWALRLTGHTCGRPWSPAPNQTRIQIFGKAFGRYASPHFVNTVFLVIPVAGVPTILHNANSSDPAWDLLPASGSVLRTAPMA
jgi:hypothetical protein